MPTVRRTVKTMKIAVARRYEEATELSNTASRANSAAMEGRAMFTAELMNGVRNAARVATMRTVRRSAVSGAGMGFFLRY